MRKYYRKIKWNIKSFKRLLSLKKEIKTKSDPWIIANVPNHGNLGDQAILMGEYKFFKDIDKDRDIIELDDDYTRRIFWVKMYSFILKKKPIFITGGGFLGTTWPEEGKRVKNIIKSFKNNKIIIMPQTIFYKDTDFGKKIKEEDIKVFNDHKDLTIYVREKFSYDMYKDVFNCKIIVAPDMVTYLEPMKKEGSQGLIYCMRSDIEKLLSDKDSIYIEKTIKKYFKENEITKTDTVIDDTFYTRDKREKAVIEKISDMSKSRLVITDRLHGMMFSILAQTPCIVFYNANYKIKGVYEWVKNNDYIFLVEDIELLDRTIELALKKADCSYDKSLVIEEFEKMKEQIRTNE